MSYILDALKRADAERARGHVPGLHAQPLAGAQASHVDGKLPRWAIATATALVMLVIAALAWRMGADTAAPVPATFSAAPAPAPASPAPGEPLEPVATTPPPPPAEPAGDTMALAPVPAPTVTSPTRADRAQTGDPAAPEGPRAPIRPAPVDTLSTGANTPLPLYAQLPAGVRQQFPALVVSGSVYSEDAGARFIMLNGEVAKEGGQPAPGLVVERIEPRSAVLRYKGERFRLPF
jgi:general secretion pathway protein B